MRGPEHFSAGVIEGFYGQPWTRAERLELLGWMAEWRLNTYVYAPKDDLHHRALWREPYPPAEAQELGSLIQACRQHQVRFVYALSPGLDIRYRDQADLDRLKERVAQMARLGCDAFAVLFDDIPDRLEPEDIHRFGCLASAQCHIANSLLESLANDVPFPSLLFCPTAYCGRMAAQQLGGEDYLPTLGCELSPEIDIFWTGPEIVSREIPVAHVEEMRSVLRRKPVIWDNLHANDYDGRRFFCGPYSGRPPALRNAVNGLLSNPNNEFPLNFVPLRTLARFIHGDTAWNPREAYLSAMREWLPRFATVGKPVGLEDLVLFGDCYYLPHEEGPEAEALYQRARELFALNPNQWAGRELHFHQAAVRLRGFCAQLVNLRGRSLFYALSRRIWELREELDLLVGCVAFKSKPENLNAPFRSDFHLPGTYRGGMAARLQRLLVLQPDGTLTPSPVTGVGRKDQPSTFTI